MDLSFLPTDLARWDQVSGDLFVVSLFSDARPLRGAAGLLDWRLCGKLSRWIREGRLSGVAGEKTLVPTRRIRFRCVLALGLGESDRYTEDGFRDALKRVAATVAGLGLASVAIEPPGRERGQLSPDRALDVTLEELGSVSQINRLTVVDTIPALKVMTERVRTKKLEPAL